MEDFQKRLDAAKRAGGYRVKVGLPSGTGSYPDGTSIIKVGVIHEFGSEDGKIPERSFLRSAMRENAKEHNKLAAKLAKAVSNGDQSPDDALELLGTKAAANVRESIVSLTSPANTAATIRAKGSSNPLVDTGLLAQSITHQVMGKGEK